MHSWTQAKKATDMTQAAISSLTSRPLQSSPFDAAAKRDATSEHLRKLAGLSLSWTHVALEGVLCHPWIVLRRQCQVSVGLSQFHLTPFSLAAILFNLQRHQGVTSAWKGLVSCFVLRGITATTESMIGLATDLPTEVEDRKVSPKKAGRHFLLKGLALTAVAPFIISGFLETIQSNASRNASAIFDFIFSGLSRLVDLRSHNPLRSIPMWKLLLPTAAFGTAHYVVSFIVRRLVLNSTRGNEEEEEAHLAMYELYYPDLAASFAGSLVADALLYPCETVLHKLFAQGTRALVDNTDTGMGVVPVITRYEGVFDCFGSIFRREGIAGFYKGFGALVLQFAVAFLLLELTKTALLRLSGHRKSVPVTPIEINLQFR